jgi:cell division protein FtsZ
VEAAQRAISSPLLEDVSISGARGVLINITGGPDLSLHEVNEAATLVQEEADEDANIIFGAVIDESMGDEVRITVIATGFGESLPHGQHRGERSAGRSGRHLGTIVEDEMEVQTYPPRRRPEATAVGPASVGGEEPSDEDYDIPTFLRRNAD